jgi:hypothetical protein
MFELFHPFKGTIISLQIVSFSCILSRDITMYSVLSAFTSSPFALLAIAMRLCFSL